MHRWLISSMHAILEIGLRGGAAGADGAEVAMRILDDDLVEELLQMAAQGSDTLEEQPGEHEENGSLADKVRRTALGHVHSGARKSLRARARCDST